jgi:hypothetical protein
MNSKIRCVRSVVLLLLAVALIAATAFVPAVATVRQEAPLQSGSVQVFGPFTPTLFTGDLRRLPQAPAWQPGDPIKEIPRRYTVQVDPSHVTEPRGYGMDPLAELQSRSPARAPRTFSTSPLNFEGIGYQPLNPPDPAGDVGRDYYVQMINTSGGAAFRVFDKATGAVVLGSPDPILLDGLGSGNCADGLGDPIVLYDHLADRWLLSEFSDTANVLCVCISATSDPTTGSWYAYEFSTPNFPDYPKYAVWPDAYYVTTNESGGPAVYAMERAQMLQGNAATMQRFAVPTTLSGFGFQALTPADLDGDRLPPQGMPGIFLRHRDTEAHGPVGNPTQDFLETFQFHVDWVTPANSTFVQGASIAVTEFDSDLCGLSLFSCFPQPGGANLDPLREVIMNRLVYRNFGTYESIVGNFVTDVNGSDVGGVRWFELRRQPVGLTACGSCVFNLYQEGTISPTTDVSRWMGSIGMDGAGNILVGYNIAGTGMYTSLAVGGRQFSDTPGTLSWVDNLFAGGASSNPSNRYGDYNTMSLDPVDDCTFWFTGEYNPSSQWSTRIGSYRYAKCPNELEVFVGEEEALPEGSQK